jgi:hypothetical protein
VPITATLQHPPPPPPPPPSSSSTLLIIRIHFKLQWSNRAVLSQTIEAQKLLREEELAAAEAKAASHEREMQDMMRRLQVTVLVR